MTEAYLLVSDVDDTLLGDDASLRDFADWRARHAQRLKLAYSSGRFYGSILDSIRSTPLPEPNAVIGGVGTNIHLHPSGELVKAWHEEIDDHWDGEVVRNTLKDLDRLELQPEEFQSPFKISYYYHDATEKEIDGIRKKLEQAGLRATVIYSSRRDLDVLPSKATKGTAAAFLASLWSFDKDHVLVAGNSGNDSALFHHGFLGIIVSNAHAELKALKGPRIYHAHGAIAAGVLEGLHHWIDGAKTHEPDR